AEDFDRSAELEIASINSDLFTVFPFYYGVNLSSIDTLRAIKLTSTCEFIGHVVTLYQRLYVWSS
ncbi:MAG: hypothetical protein P8I13_05515, partial [Porticoccaceae bacterium]|nr:hypothetical protein [Porticoccaceae bacterium]